MLCFWYISTVTLVDKCRVVDALRIVVYAPLSVHPYLNTGVSFKSSPISQVRRIMIERLLSMCAPFFFSYFFTETDDGRKERKSPWPAAMSEKVWAGRVKLRIAMKEEMSLYKQARQQVPI